MKEFGVALKRVEQEAEVIDDREFVECKVYGRELKVYHPDEGQYAMLMLYIGDAQTFRERTAGIINFFMKILDPEGAGYIQSILLDHAHPFDIEELIKMLGWLNEEWSGKATEPPSDSTPSPTSNGSTSTPPTQLLI